MVLPLCELLCPTVNSEPHRADVGAGSVSLVPHAFQRRSIAAPDDCPRNASPPP